MTLLCILVALVATSSSGWQRAQHRPCSATAVHLGHSAYKLCSTRGDTACQTFKLRLGDIAGLSWARRWHELQASGSLSTWAILFQCLQTPSLSGLGMEQAALSKDTGLVLQAQDKLSCGQ